jgi:peptidoglycan/xylan/chitin deacetylase (PgdA/CDA1 family)
MSSHCKAVYVLAYHSQNVRGNTYETSDRLAFAADLSLLRELEFTVVSAMQLVKSLRAGSLRSLPEKCVVLTMDDAPLSDYCETSNPPHAGQDSMLTSLRKQHRRIFGLAVTRPPFVATAFAIASPEARRQLSAGTGMAWFTDSWWRDAQRSGYLDIGTHSWNHVHPDLEEMASQPRLKAAFHNVDSVAEADRQVVQASRSVRAITGSDAAGLFAYPYGRTNDFLVREYLPRQDTVIGAFTTQPEPVTESTGIWEIPRFVCGDAWTTRDGLRALLLGRQ